MTNYSRSVPTSWIWAAKRQFQIFSEQCPSGAKTNQQKTHLFRYAPKDIPSMAALRIMLRMPKRSRHHTTGRRPGWSGRRCCTLAIGLPPKRWGPAPEQKPLPMAALPPSVGCGNAKPTAVCRGICYPRLPTPPCGKPALLSHRAGFPRFTPFLSSSVPAAGRIIKPCIA